LRYRDIAAAIAWLGAAFGFQLERVATGADGTIDHALLTFGNDVIMLLPARGPESDMRPLDAAAERQSCYFVVADVDLHHRRAKAAGAEILDITQDGFGGRGYACRDPEGHVWNFGTLDPRPKPTHDASAHARGHRRSSATLGAGRRWKFTPHVIVAAILAVLVSAATVGWTLLALPQVAATGKDRRTATIAHQPIKEKAADTSTPAREPAELPAPVRSLRFGGTALQQGAEADQRAGGPAPAAISAAAEVPPPVEKASEPGQAEDAKLAAERAAQEAMRQWRAAQETLRRLAREQSAKEAAERAALEAQSRAAVAAAKAQAPSPRKLVAKEAKRAAQETRKRQTGEERAKLSIVEPGADCAPTPPTGEILCHPRAAKPPSPAGPQSAARSARVPTAEPRAEPQQPSERNAEEQLWDCQPRPPAGQVICAPIPAGSKR
jgi:uncharacterized glyoxalase superfamily protein PhnB